MLGKMQVLTVCVMGISLVRCRIRCTAYIWVCHQLQLRRIRHENFDKIECKCMCSGLMSNIRKKGGLLSSMSAFSTDLERIQTPHR